MLAEASAPATWMQLTTAALLSRPSGAAGLLTAARILAIVDSAPRRPIVIVPKQSSSRSPIATLVRRDLDPHEITSVGGMRTTTAARTLVDLAAATGPVHLGRMVDGAMGRRLTTPVLLDRAMEATPNLTRTARWALMRALEVWRSEIRPGSVGEARLLRQLDEWGFEPPDRQVSILDEAGQVIARVDVGWTALRLGLEYDSIEWHGPARWESDEARHRRIEALGWRLLHVDADDLRPGSTLGRRLRAMRDRILVGAPGGR